MAPLIGTAKVEIISDYPNFSGEKFTAARPRGDLTESADLEKWKFTWGLILRSSLP